MTKKLGFIISGILLCFIASIVLNEMALFVIENKNTAYLYYLLLPVLMFVFGVSTLSKGIRVKVRN
ncbi:hypothetical protein [Psychroserpens sp.]|uniref:hypothetical protein n=1 Tax=Psychroserpens sp. TaxID=2020870 RepID=UPI001B1B0CA9|nr:hypothetical protein [Psychroserpens sp.]MBO6606937.1 hypothetical protein [Psychroserpens sp.]MBO6631928.1 hypothetical protein [Psychroserpens sp.]MBO6654083.1 hypothetical protein [Psychroserpens sp.]MBO6682631.1 hypothetical protein [Psychroserpens sp.]MBO6750709.1 hypothetical protein [Psychroserpens sp.]